MRVGARDERRAVASVSAEDLARVAHPVQRAEQQAEVAVVTGVEQHLWVSGLDERCVVGVLRSASGPVGALGRAVERAEGHLRMVLPGLGGKGIRKSDPVGACVVDDEELVQVERVVDVQGVSRSLDEVGRDDPEEVVPSVGRERRQARGRAHGREVVLAEGRLGSAGGPREGGADNADDRLVRGELLGDGRRLRR